MKRASWAARWVTRKPGWLPCPRPPSAVTRPRVFIPPSLHVGVHPASRALQRSRSVIRHALQRHQRSKQYCMYYNRFGRCSRGEGCPYIHDPDKVAVCTRYGLTLMPFVRPLLF